MNGPLTQELKAIIVNKGLVVTGRLRDSIEVYTNLKGNTMTVDIRCADYFKYLNEPYALLSTFTESATFKIEMQNGLAPWIESIVQSTLEGIPVDFPNPRVIILLNGV